jgi:hypothetical protein
MDTNPRKGYNTGARQRPKSGATRLGHVVARCGLAEARVTQSFSPCTPDKVIARDKQPADTLNT